MKKRNALKLATVMACVISGSAIADMAPPPQATPPIAPQARPVPQKPSTSIQINVAQAVVPANTAPAKQGQAVTEKMRHEIQAMLADEVQKVENVVIIDHKPVAATAQPAVASSQLSIADQPNGHFRVFAEIMPSLEKDKIIVKLQLLKAGHSGDANDMVKPLTEKTIKVNPKKVRDSAKTVRKFLSSKLHIGNVSAQTALGRPNLSMWIEVKNADGSEDVKTSSKLIIYYKPDSNLYVNLYYISTKNKIERLVPSKMQVDNFVKKGQIYRFPATGEGFSVSGKGTDKVRAIYTRTPSGAGVDLGLSNGLQARQAPIGVIPTQYPAVFSTADLSKFFSLPDALFNEKEISYEIK